MIMSETDRAYLAGIIDGEGCVGVSRRLQKYLTPTVQVSNTKRKLIEWLHIRYGGSFYEIDGKRRGRKDFYLWTVAGQKALTVLRDARPYLLLKCEQADILLAIPRQSTKDRDSLGRIKGKMGPAEFAANEQVVLRIRELNRRGIQDASC